MRHLYHENLHIFEQQAAQGLARLPNTMAVPVIPSHPISPPSTRVSLDWTPTTDAMPERGKYTCQFDDWVVPMPVEGSAAWVEGEAATNAGQPPKGPPITCGRRRDDEFATIRILHRFNRVS